MLLSHAAGRNTVVQPYRNYGAQPRPQKKKGRTQRTKTKGGFGSRGAAVTGKGGGRSFGRSGAGVSATPLGTLMQLEMQNRRWEQENKQSDDRHRLSMQLKQATLDNEIIRSDARAQMDAAKAKFAEDLAASDARRNKASASTAEANAETAQANAETAGQNAQSTADKNTAGAQQAKAKAEYAEAQEKERLQREKAKNTRMRADLNLQNVQTSMTVLGGLKTIGNTIVDDAANSAFANTVGLAGVQAATAAYQSARVHTGRLAAGLSLAGGVLTYLGLTMHNQQDEFNAKAPRLRGSVAKLHDETKMKQLHSDFITGPQSNMDAARTLYNHYQKSTGYEARNYKIMGRTDSLETNYYVDEDRKEFLFHEYDRIPGIKNPDGVHNIQGIIPFMDKHDKEGHFTRSLEGAMRMQISRASRKFYEKNRHLSAQELEVKMEKDFNQHVQLDSSHPDYAAGKNPPQMLSQAANNLANNPMSAGMAEPPQESQDTGPKTNHVAVYDATNRIGQMTEVDQTRSQVRNQAALAMTGMIPL